MFWTVAAWAAIPPTKIFSWTASVVDATHGAPTSYTIKCGTTTGGPYPNTISVTGAPVPVTVAWAGWTVGTPPVQGTFYCIATASNASGESGPSNEVNFIWTPPSPPTNETVQ